MLFCKVLPLHTAYAEIFWLSMTYRLGEPRCSHTLVEQSEDTRQLNLALQGESYGYLKK